MRDPIVEEVRKHRMAHTRRFRGDLSAICANLRSVQIASGHLGLYQSEHLRTSQPFPREFLPPTRLRRQISH